MARNATGMPPPEAHQIRVRVIPVPRAHTKLFCCLHSLATDAVKQLSTNGPRPARFAVGQLQRVVLKGASLFGMQSLEDLDEYLKMQMQAADILIARAEKAIMCIYDAPETQQLLMKVPRWLPFSGANHTQLGAHHPHTHAFHKGSGPRVCRAAPPQADCPPPQQTQLFSRRALAEASAAESSAGFTPRTFDDAAWEQLQYSPKKTGAPSAAFSRRAHASALTLRTFDEETLARLAHLDDAYHNVWGGIFPGEGDKTSSARASSSASEASTEPHSSPTNDPFAAFNPAVPAIGLLSSVGNLFDTNPVAPTSARVATVHVRSTFSC